MSAPEPDGDAALDRHLQALAERVMPQLRRLSDKARRGRLVPWSKGGDPGDLVTAADFEIEELLAVETARAFPADGFLGEEGGWRCGPSRLRNWIVDPLDGTRNLACGLPWGCCSIAAFGPGTRRAGLVLDPFRDETYLGVQRPGRAGAAVGGEPVAVAPGDDLAGRIVLLELPAGLAPGALDPVRALVASCGGAVRSMGSAALAMALVAAGRAQAVVHAGPQVWDVAAGAVLVEAAGGAVVGPAGQRAVCSLEPPGPLVAGSFEVCALLAPALRACFDTAAGSPAAGVAMSTPAPSGATPGPVGGRPFVWAHRGASSLAPENTLRAFELAAGVGADGVELDVQLSADGVPVVLHDPFVWADGGRHHLRPPPAARATMRALWVAATPWAELAARLVVHPDGSAEPLVRLEQVLEAVPEALWVDVELKAGWCYDPRLVEVVIGCLARRPERVLVSSFDHVVLAEAARRSPELPRLAILHARPIELPALLATIPTSSASIDRPFFTRSDIERWSGEGMAVSVGGSELLDDLDEVLGWPVAGVFLDDPTLANAHSSKAERD